MIIFVVNITTTTVFKPRTYISTIIIFQNREVSRQWGVDVRFGVVTVGAAGIVVGGKGVACRGVLQYLLLFFTK